MKFLLAGLVGAGAVPTALFLFGEGLVGVHHVWRAHHLMRNPEDETHAHKMVHDFENRIDQLSPERAQELVNRLLRQYEGQ